MGEVGGRSSKTEASRRRQAADRCRRPGRRKAKPGGENRAARRRARPSGFPHGQGHLPALRSEGGGGGGGAGRREGGGGRWPRPPRPACQRRPRHVPPPGAEPGCQQQPASFPARPPAATAAR